MPRFLKITLFVILFLAVAAYVVYSFFIMKSTNPEEVCDDVVIMIDDDKDAFVDSLKVMEILDEEGVNPMGKKMKDINLKEIERSLLKNTFVTSIDCYVSNNGMEVGKGSVCLRVKQIIPAMLVYDRQGDRFYVDPQGNIIEADSLYPRNMLVANGEINRQYIVSDLAAFAQFVKSDPFWDNQIEQVYVEFDKNKQRVVTLIPRVGDQKIFLGPIDGYDRKLARLKKFYERGLPVVGWNKYSILNLEYDNQVVGIIRGQEPGQAADSMAVVSDDTPADITTQQAETENNKKLEMETN